MANFLRIRNGNYYLRLRVPSDLNHLSNSPEILKSLRTSDHRSAQLSAAALRTQFLQLFALARTGFITHDQARDRFADLLERKTKARRGEVPPSTPPTLSLQQAIIEYTRDHVSAWTAKTRLEYESYYKLILDVIGDRCVNEINRDVVRTLRETLCRLPPHLYKKYPEKSIKEILAIDGITPMSITTVNKLLSLFSSVMLHCIKEGYRKDNPADGLKMKLNRRADEERKAYSKEDVQRIVSALPSPTTKPERHWIPLIGLYSGMRLGEICGMYLEDVKQIDGVWCCVFRSIATGIPI